MVRTGGDIDLAAPAELIGHPARAAILLTLLDGRRLPMTTLAAEAGVAASTASAHLSRLVAGGLLDVARQGRHRYYGLASQTVAEALEALAHLAKPKPVRSLRAGTRANALRTARTCYDHVAGHLGVAIMGSLLRSKALAGGDGRHHAEHARQIPLSAPGRDRDYQLGAAGWWPTVSIGQSSATISPVRLAPAANTMPPTTAPPTATPSWWLAFNVAPAPPVRKGRREATCDGRHHEQTQPQPVAE